MNSTTNKNTQIKTQSNELKTPNNNKNSEKQETPHPYDSKLYFQKNPPIPMWNVVIDNKTLNIIENNTGQP